MPADTEKHTPLLPCPFCGGEAKYSEDHTVERTDTVSCRRCDFYLSDPGDTGSCIAAWNRRAPDPVREKLMEALEGTEEAILGWKQSLSQRDIQMLSEDESAILVTTLDGIRSVLLLAKGEKA